MLKVKDELKAVNCYHNPLEWSLYWKNCFSNTPRYHARGLWPVGDKFIFPFSKKIHNFDLILIKLWNVIKMLGNSD